jgi:hypothetical protein
VDPFGIFRPRRNVADAFTASQWRRRSAEARYDTALRLYRDVGWIEEGLLFDEEDHGVFRFEDGGVFAFSREYANWAELERRGFEP